MIVQCNFYVFRIDTSVKGANVTIIFATWCEKYNDVLIGITLVSLS